MPDALALVVGVCSHCVYMVGVVMGPCYVVWFLVSLHRGSYMSAHVLLNLLNELGKSDKMRGLSSILSLFRSEFNEFNNTRARMLDSIYHMTPDIITN